MTSCSSSSFVDVGPDRAARLRVEADRGLVEEQHARGVQQAAGDLQAPLHAAGEGAHQGSRVAPTAAASRAPSACAARSLARHPVQLGVQAQVLLGREVVVERGVLEDETDVASHAVAFWGPRPCRPRAPSRRWDVPACRASRSWSTCRRRWGRGSQTFPRARPRSRSRARLRSRRRSWSGRARRSRGRRCPYPTSLQRCAGRAQEVRRVDNEGVAAAEWVYVFRFWTIHDSDHRS